MAFLAKLLPDGRSAVNSMDHLACFAPGMLALGYLHGFPKSHLSVAKNLTHTCYELYHRSPCGLGPDETSFNTNIHSKTDFYTKVSVGIAKIPVYRTPPMCCVY